MPQIELRLIDPNPNNPRKLFDIAKLEELAASIRENGLMRPIKVRPKGERYELVAGERRWRAHILLAERGQLPDSTIDAIVEAMDDRQRDIEAIPGPVDGR